jgi:hypothetical protein
MKKWAVQVVRGANIGAFNDLDTGVSKGGGTAGSLGTWITGGIDNARDARLDEPLGARWGPALMGTRFEGDVRPRASGTGPGQSQSHSFGVRATAAGVVANPHDLARRVGDDTPDQGVWFGAAVTSKGRPGGEFEHLLIGVVAHHDSGAPKY